MTKTTSGFFFEDFRLGQSIRHAGARTLTAGEAALYAAIYGSRFAVQSADPFAAAIGYPQSPLDDLLVFHTVFGKTVADVSLNAVANLGYAEARMLAAVYPGDTLTARSEVIGLRENSNGRSGIVYVRSAGQNQRGERVLEFVRWAMVRKRAAGGASRDPVVPTLAAAVDPAHLGAACPLIRADRFDPALSGSPWRWGDYQVGERLDHVDGATVEEAEHQMATRLYQNGARVHFDQFSAGATGRRLVYGGHVMSIARALTFNGLGNAFHLCAINGGRHVAPLHAGSTVFAWSEILDKASIPDRTDVGGLRLRTIATKDRRTHDFPLQLDDGAYDPAVILDLDYWALLPI